MDKWAVLCYTNRRRLRGRTMAQEVASRETDSLLRVAEAAALLQVHPKTLWRWVKAGRAKPSARTLGGHMRFRRSDLLALRKQMITSARQ